jgi:hexosaminidase
MKVVVSLALALCLWAGSAAALWPIPASYKSGNSTLWIDRNVQISYNGGSNVRPLAAASYLSLLHLGQQLFFQASSSYQSTASSNTMWTNKIVQNAINRTVDTLFNKNFVPWKFHPRFSDFEPKLTGSSVYIKTINLKQNGSDPSDIEKPTAGNLDESYSLSVTTAGEVTITAATSIGLLYGLTTFTQLFFKTSSGDGVYTILAPVEITDAPKFPWRGLNVDTSRTFKPMSDLYAMVDALSYNKMNRLHWHVTDAQAWPLEIPSMPELADKGAYIGFQKYSPEDVKALQEYGALLGVEVAVEIDNPGHTSSIAFSHPDLIAAFNVQPDWSTYAAEPPSGTLKLNSTDVYNFLEKLFDDLLPRLKPLTSYFHLGGDEVNVNAYLLEDTVGSNSTAVLQPLMQKYMDRNMKQVQGAGLVPLVWEEMLLTWNLTLPPETIIQTWLSDASVGQVTAKGYKALAGNYNYWYLDCGQGQWLDFYPGASSANNWPYADYCSPRHNWRLMYSYDPLTGVPANATHLVLGGETHIWSEQTDPVNLDQMVWPRTCAAGEVLWSGAKDASGQNRSQILASPRLNEMRERLVARGIRAEPIQMPYCTQNSTLPQCAL